MEDILKELKLVFHEKYDEKATKSYFSPGRVNLIGEHIDYNGVMYYRVRLLKEHTVSHGKEPIKRSAVIP